MRAALLVLVLASCAAPVATEPVAIEAGAAVERPVVVILESRGERIEVTTASLDGPEGERLRQMTAPHRVVTADVDLALMTAD